MHACMQVDEDANLLHAQETVPLCLRHLETLYAGNLSPFVLSFLHLLLDAAGLDGSCCLLRLPAAAAAAAAARDPLLHAGAAAARAAAASERRPHPYLRLLDCLSP